MIEYTIHGKFKIKDIRFLWEEFFEKDENWHFNFYDGFIRLKLSKNYPKLNDYILRKKWKWEQNPYNQETETLPVFKRNFDLFCQFLHAFALLIIKEKEIKKVEERILHLFMNMEGMEYWDEAIVLNQYAIRRAYLEGCYKGISDSKKF